ncbi:MAG: hypothetical protein LPH21_11595 [Shewanella sp.]|nr:hypothetical protein [Shewanella sp.]
MKQVTGNDVIGLPGQNLTQTELRALVGLADGETPSQTAQAVATDSIGLRAIERQLQRKLGAITKTHLIALGFVTGVLITRALCLLLAITFTTDDGQQFTRIRTRIRTPHTIRV